MFTPEELLELQLMAQAIWDYHPQATWELPVPDFNRLVWKEEGVESPTWEEIEGRIAVLRVEWEKNQYKRDRASSYPSFAEQFDLMYHHGFDAWKEKIESIKVQFPKPEESGS